MKQFLVTVLLLVAPTISHAGLLSSGEDSFGVGYLAKADGTKIYERSEGDAVAATVHKNFPLVAYESRNSWLGIIASESIVSGRAHVRYWKNGLNSKNGENTAWVDQKEVERFQFDCCGDNGHCSGITDPLLKTGGYTDCFTHAMAASIQKRMATAGNGAHEREKSKVQVDSNDATELEKLKLQLELEKLKLEIEKLKLEQERLKAGVK